jgi:hypothetical protein
MFNNNRISELEYKLKWTEDRLEQTQKCLWDLYADVNLITDLLGVEYLSTSSKRKLVKKSQKK